MRMINAIRQIANYRSPRCQMWYQRVIEMRSPDFESTTVQDIQPSTSSSQQRKWVDDKELEDSPAQFRRVRLKSRSPSIKAHSSPSGTRTPSVASPVPQQSHTTHSYLVQGHSIQSYGPIYSLDQQGIHYYNDDQRHPGIEVIQTAPISSSKHKKKRRLRQDIFLSLLK